MSADVCFGVVGPRSDFMAAPPVHQSLHSLESWLEFVLVYRGQRHRIDLSAFFLEELDQPAPDIDTLRLLRG